MKDPVLMLMMFAAAADGSIDEIEVSKIINTANSYPYWKGLTEEQKFDLSFSCQDVLNANESKEAAVKSVCDLVPVKLRFAAFAFCFEVIASNFKINDAESGFVKLIFEALSISDEFAAACEHSILARYFSVGNEDYIKTFV